MAPKRISLTDSESNLNVIDLTYQDTDEGCCVIMTESNPPTKRCKIKQERPTGTPSGEQTPCTTITSEDEKEEKEKKMEIYNEVEILEGHTIPKSMEEEVVTADQEEESNNDVAVVGMKNHVSLPHMRQHCTQKPFLKDDSWHSLNVRCNSNAQFCELCYCYICDVPVKECKGDWLGHHCLATDEGRNKYVWAEARQKMRVIGHCPTETQYDDLGLPYLFELRDSQFLENDGPWAPDTAEAEEATDRKDPILIRCRHCNWYNKKVAKVQSSPGCHHWCKACGRVASESYLGKQQSTVYNKVQDDIYLGCREIPFTVHIPDVRQMERFSTNWKDNMDTWTYSVADQEEELVQHRLGKHPVLSILILSIPVMAADKIPKDGNVDRVTDLDASANETQAISIPNMHDFELLQSIWQCNRDFGQPADLFHTAHRWAYAYGDLECTWDRMTREGKIKVRVYLQKKKHAHRTFPFVLTKLLGSWFRIGPFPLLDVIHLKASQEAKDFSYDEFYSLSYIRRISAAKEAEEDEAGAIMQYNEQAKPIRRDLFTLTSGTGLRGLGGICTNETDFAGILKRFLREVSFLCSNRSRMTIDWSDIRKGVVSKHRDLHNRYSSLSNLFDEHRYGQNHCDMGPFLSSESKRLLNCMKEDVQCIREHTKSLKGLMDHFENRGHAMAPMVDGLTVELQPFQLQSLQWAIEREVVSGGIQSFFWAKLPDVAEPNTDVYYNPVLGQVSTTRPALVRGGFLADEMGLGKTIESLALILSNPAPSIPEPGSHASTIPAQPDPAYGGRFWDPKLYERTSTGKPKQGSIISHGTLVVCNVSLVGQWVAEAKDKLKNPGIVYSYYGTSRIRDPRKLAKSSIVVTTYETLSSDATYHARQSMQHDYVPPCSQVRWWRVICDESHIIRHTSGKSNAVTDLIADNKWLMSGTPINTSIMDLSNQLQFLGIEKCKDYMTVFKHCVDDHRNYRGDDGKDKLATGMITFFMRSIMMRHSQRMKYRESNITLMSLPPKTERVISVDFSDLERIEYDKLEVSAREFYVSFKSLHGQSFGKHYLKLLQKLAPLRTSCSGGQVSVDDYCAENLKKSNDHDDENEVDNKQLFSDFSFESKLSILIAELERIRIDDKTSKCLIFSQHTSTLNWLKAELPKRGFQFRTLSGDMTMQQRAKALQAFQNDPPTTVFLLSIRAGACGINMTQANKVVIMEPCLNPSLEAQAIGRVYRMGQIRAVEVIRLIMKNSVESRLQTMLAKKYDIKEQKSHHQNVTKVVAPVLAGSIASDKAQILQEEFDLLFGISSVAEQKSDYAADNKDYNNYDKAYL